jgi:hypothetical protein
MPVQTFAHVFLRADLQPRLVSPRLQTQCLSDEHPCTLLPSTIHASQTARVSALSPSAVDHRRAGMSLQQVLDRSRARRLAMIVLTLLRMATSVWTEARSMQAETMRRYPHLRDQTLSALRPIRTVTEVSCPC